MELDMTSDIHLDFDAHRDSSGVSVIILRLRRAKTPPAAPQRPAGHAQRQRQAVPDGWPRCRGGGGERKGNARWPKTTTGPKTPVNLKHKSNHEQS